MLFLQKLGCRTDLENDDGVTVNKIICHEKKAHDIRMGIKNE